jgi:DNA-binding IclR family transcriptional regulator
LLHCGEVAAVVELRPVDDLVVPLRGAPDGLRDVAREDRDAGRGGRRGGGPNPPYRSVGDTFAMHTTATGRSMLAYYPPDKLAETVGAQRCAELEPVLESVRAAGGIGVSRGEAVPGVQAIAAVILSRRQTPIASVSVSGVDLGEQIDPASRLASTLRRAAGAIGQMIP